MQRANRAAGKTILQLYWFQLSDSNSRSVSSLQGYRSSWDKFLESKTCGSLKL